MLSMLIVVATLTWQSPAQPAGDPARLSTQARRLNSAGKQDEAIELYRKALAIDPDSFDANLGIGIALDLKGDYAQARKNLTKAIEVAKEDMQEQALTAMAVSYAFEGDAKDAAIYLQRLFDAARVANNLDAAASAANALARVYLETGDIASAEKWYQTGNETARRMSGLPTDQVDLWQMRWEHALGRIAARKGDKASAIKHAATVKALIDKSRMNAEQMPIYQYLVGYIAFYSGDDDGAITELQKGDLTDPFIVSLIAQAYERKHDDAHAREFYQKVLALNAHNLQNAFARPLAKKKLAQMPQV